jgi:hypothetical protein
MTRRLLRPITTLGGALGVSRSASPPFVTPSGDLDVSRFWTILDLRPQKKRIFDPCSDGLDRGIDTLTRVERGRKGSKDGAPLGVRALTVCPVRRRGDEIPDPSRPP